MCACRKTPPTRHELLSRIVILNGEKRGGKATAIQAFPAWGRETASAVDRVLSYAEQMRRAFPYTTSCLSYHSHPIRPYGAPSPRGEGCDMRIPSSKQAAHHPYEPIRSPSTVIPSAAEGSLLHGHHMHTCTLTQTTPWCFLFRLSLAHDLPLCKKDPSTAIGMTGGRRVISHSLSHRCVDPSCAFGAARLATQEGALMGRLGASLD